jgi:hypothetical protein
MVRAFYQKVVVRDRVSVTEFCERVAVLINQREINIGDADIVYSLLVQKELGLKQHGYFLLGGVGAVQSDLETIAPGNSNRRFPYKRERHERFRIAVVSFFTLQPLG